MRPREVGLLHTTRTWIWIPTSVRRQASPARLFGTIIKRPRRESPMKEKMGFLTQAKSPLVTSSVFFDSSTPTRHESPIEN